MLRNRRLVLGGVAVLLVLVVAAGFRFGPDVVSAAQSRLDPTPEANTTAPTSPEAAPAAQTPAPQATPGPKQQEARAWLGVAIQSVEGGAKVAQVVPDSPAAKAGLQKDDKITAVNGTAVANVAELQKSIAALKPGDKASLTVDRGGQTQTIEVTLGTQPKRIRVQAGPLPNLGLFGPLGGPLGNLLPDLRDVPADQRFDHFRGGSFSYTDKDGNPVTIEVTPGVLTAVAADSVTVRPNGQTTESTFHVGADTRVFPGSRDKLADTMKVNDKVLIVVKQGAPDALAVQDLTALQSQRAGNNGRGFVLPAPNGGQFRFAPPESFGGSDLQKRLDDLQKRLDDLEQRNGGAGSRTAF